LAFEVAGEMGELLVPEVHGDELDGLARLKAAIGGIEAEISEPFAKSAAVEIAKVSLDGAGGDAAELRNFAGLELRAMGKGLPIQIPVRSPENGCVKDGKVIGLHHASGFSALPSISLIQ
jgi:hypothetical protein